LVADPLKVILCRGETKLHLVTANAKQLDGLCVSMYPGQLVGRLAAAVSDILQLRYIHSMLQWGGFVTITV
jgi:hypothetical protein